MMTHSQGARSFRYSDEEFAISTFHYDFKDAWISEDRKKTNLHSTDGLQGFQLRSQNGGGMEKFIIRIAQDDDIFFNLHFQVSSFI